MGKSEQEYIHISSKKKCVPRKFLEVVVVQNNGKEMNKKVWLHVQSCFFFLLIRPNVVVVYFLLFFTVSLAYHDFSGALRCAAEHHRKENMVTYAFENPSVPQAY